MFSLQSNRLCVELPEKPSAGLSFRRLRRPTPLPTLQGSLQPGLVERVLDVLRPGQAYTFMGRR